MSITAYTKAQADTEFAGKGASSELKLYVSPNGNDSSDGLSPGTAYATINKALTVAAANSGAHIYLSRGTFAAPTAGIPSNTSIRGAGKGQTVVTNVSGAQSAVFTNADQTNGNDRMLIADLTIDGNKAAWTSGANAYCIWWVRPRSSTIRNVELKNAHNNGLFIDGSEANDTRYIWLSDIEAHDNGHHGGQVSNGTRAVTAKGIIAYSNSQDGWWIDHSESTYDDVHAYQNGQRGVYIRNVFDNNVSNIKATRNGQHGIHVVAMTHSVGSSWVAMDNGGTGYQDIYFEATGLPTWGYGQTSNTVISTVKAGHAINSAFSFKPNNSVSGPTADYAVYLDDGMEASNLVLSDVMVNAEVLGGIRQPSAGRGKLIIGTTNVARVMADVLAQTDVANTTTETIVTSYTVPANTVRPGDHYRVRLYATVDYISTSGTLDVRLRLGGTSGTILSDVQAGSQTTGATGKNFSFDVELICRSVSSGTATWLVTGTGLLDFTANTSRLVFSTATRAISADDVLCLTASWQTANAGNAFHVQSASITRVA